MLRKNLALLIAAALIIPIALAGSAQSADYVCKADGGRTDLAANNVTPGAVDDGEIDKFWLTVPNGQTGYLAVQMSHGDLDVRVCKKSNNALMCQSTNVAFVHDGCHASQLSVQCPDEICLPDSYFVQWGDGLPAGQYRLDINHCFSSQDNPGEPDTYCDYAATDPVLGDPLAPGGLDPVPAIQYAIIFATN